MHLMAASFFVLPPLQRRREAYRRYCKLRDQGKLAGGANPPLSAADTVAHMSVHGLGLSDDEAGAACGAGRAGASQLASVEEGAEHGAAKPWAAANGATAGAAAAPGALAAPALQPPEPFDAAASSPAPQRRRFGLFGGGFFRRQKASQVCCDGCCGCGG